MDDRDGQGIGDSKEVRDGQGVQDEGIYGQDGIPKIIIFVFIYI